MRKRNLISVIVATCLLSGVPWAPAGAQSTAPPPYGPSLGPGRTMTQYVHRVWTSRDHLPQSSINGIAQTPDGHLWFATLGGLVRFDGLSFATFNSVNAPSLQNNRLTAVAVDSEGTLWIGTEAAELIVFRDDDFRTVGIGDGNAVKSIGFDQDGSPLMSTEGRTYRLSGDGLVRILDAGGQLAQAADGALWVSGLEGVYHIDGDVVTRIQEGGDAVSIVTGDSGEAWVGHGGGLSRFDGASLGDAVVIAGIEEEVTALLVNRAGTLWMGTGTGGLLRYQHEHGGFQRFPEPLSTRAGAVTALFEDREGNLWVGTGTDGVHQFVDGMVTGFEREDGLPGQVGPVAEGPDGALWLGGDCGPLLRYESGVFRDAEIDGTRGECIRALLFARSGALWIGHGSTLTRVSEGHTTHLDAPREVSSLFEDDSGQVWVGTFRGLFRLEQDRFIPFELGGEAGSEQIAHLSADRTGNLWIATRAGVARVVDGATDWFTQAKGMSYGFARHVYHNGAGAAWVATYGGGLNRITEDRIVPVTSAHGLCDDFISIILDDAHGRLWFNGNAGIFYVDQADLDAVADGRINQLGCTLLGAEDGMKTIEGRAGGGKSADGRLWFPNLRGLSKLDPANLAHNPVPPTVFIESVTAGDTLYAESPPLPLPAESRDLEIRYAATTFRNPQRARFEYRLDGHDNHWVDAGNRRNAFYTNLAPGSYRFQLRAFNESGIMSESRAVFSFSVDPFVHETVWFRGGVVLLGIALVSGANSIRLRRLRSYAKALEAEISEKRRLQREVLDISSRERQRIGQELHDGLGQQLTGIGFLARALERRFDNQGAAAADEVQTLRQRITDTLRQTRFTAQGLMPTSVDPKEFDAAMTDLAEHAEQWFGLEARACVASDVRIEDGELASALYQIAREALTNTARHANATTVAIDVIAADAGVRLTVTDNGIGIPDGDLLRDGLGLRIMRYRADLVGASFEISCGHDQGTVVTCLVTEEQINTKELYQ